MNGTHPVITVVEAQPALDSGYADSFRCIGSACEDTCCQGWTVTIDDATYAKYQSLPPGPLLQRLQSSLVQITEGQSSWNFARITMQQDESCPLLDTERLCSIQKEHGAALLSRVCTQYPRVTQTAEHQRQALLLSCPEAARLVLLDPELLPALQQHRPGERYSAFTSFDPERGQDRASQRQRLRDFSLLLLSDRAYPLWQRLFLLGAFTRRLDTLLIDKREDRAPALLNEYATVAETGGLLPLMERIVPQPTLQLMLVLQLLGERARLGKVNARFEDLLARFTRGIGYQAGSTVESLTPACLRAFTEVYEPWRERHPLLIENYLVNGAVASLFPLGAGGEQPLQQHLRIAIHYGLIQGLLIGIAGDPSATFDTEDAISLIQSFAKTIEIYPGFIERAIRIIELAGLDPMDAANALIHVPAL